MGLSNIFTIEDKNSLVCDLFTYVLDKCDCGEKIGELSREERVFFVVQSLESEVNNGGFDQYFWNSSGNEAMEAVAAFNELGANITAEIVQKALSIFPNSEAPKDWFKRQDFMDEMPEEQRALLSELDDEFYEYLDDLLQLSYDYVMKNQDNFR